MIPIILTDMQSLASPEEIGKLIGTIKEPEQIQNDQKQLYILYGMLIFSVCTISFFAIQHYMQKNKQKDKV
jgi:hypothetical protein